MGLSKVLLLSFIITTFLSCGPKPSSGQKSVVADSFYTYGTPSPDGSGKFYLGREISHVMGVAGASSLERAEREKEEGIKLVLKKLPLSPTSVVADIGAGTGYYSFKMAALVPRGKIYAVELQDELISYLNLEAQSRGTKNISIIKGSEFSPNLPDTAIDLAIMVDVYHELAYPHEMLQNIYKSLKPGGKLLLLEYKMEDPSIPIKTLHKMSVKQVDKEMKMNGYKSAAYSGDLPIQHYLMYQKPL